MVLTSCGGRAAVKEAEFLAEANVICLKDLKYSNKEQDFSVAARDTLPLGCQFVFTSDDLKNSDDLMDQFGSLLVEQAVAKDEEELLEIAPGLCFDELGKPGAAFDLSLESRTSLPIICQFAFLQNDRNKLVQLKADLGLKLEQQIAARAEAEQSADDATVAP